MMDLQLGLSVSTNSVSPNNFDLNFSDAHFINNSNVTEQQHRNHRLTKRRCFSQSSYSEEQKNINVVIAAASDQTLPLFLWNDDDRHRNDDVADQENLDSSSSSSSSTVITTDNDYSYYKNDDDDDDDDEKDTNGLVGWPPINPLRKRICHGTGAGAGGEYSVTVENCGRRTASSANNKRGENKSSSSYVKVKMEGVGIARKVDITLHHSTHSLFKTLLTMFGKCHQESIHSYVLFFQDQEGDWKIADQVPWRVLMESVQRLKLQRKTTT